VGRLEVEELFLRSIAPGETLEDDAVTNLPEIEE
jgi:hypothetical protein